MRLPILILLLVFCTGVASAAPNKIKHHSLNPTQGPLLVGHLEVLWGDSHDGAPPIMRVSLALGEGGQRIELDPVQASEGASDLASLVGRRVAIQFAPLQAGRDPSVQAIVSAEKEVHADGSPVVASPSVSGSTAWVSVACKFSDKMLEPVSVKWMGNQMGSMRGGLDHYWRLMSYNHINLQGSASYGWFTLPHTEAYYQGEFPTSNLNVMKKDCLDAADSAVDFSQFQNIKMSFNGQIPEGRSWGGKRCETLDGVYACRGMVWMNFRSLSSAPVIAHEMGHGYGLWHSDNSDEDDNTYDNVWDVMSSTSKTFVDTHPVFGN